MAAATTITVLWALVALATPTVVVSQASPRTITSYPWRQWITVHSNLSGTGEFFNITDQVLELNNASYSYPASRELLNDRIRSICGVGVWVLYEHSQFTGASDLIQLKNGDCVNLHTVAQVSSIRPVGDLFDYTGSTFTLFAGTEYTDKNLILEYSTSRISMMHRSFIVTGSSSWAIFDQVNYKGKSVCLKPVSKPHQQVEGVPDQEVVPYNIPAGSIRSVRKGCFGNETRQVDVGSGIRLASQGTATFLISVMSIILSKILLN